MKKVIEITGTLLDYVDFFDIVRKEYRFISESMAYIREENRLGSFLNYFMPNMFWYIVGLYLFIIPQIILISFTIFFFY